MRPSILIPVPTSGDLLYNAKNWTAYADCVASSGGEPIRLELNPFAAGDLLKSAHGICLPGSPADVEPARYGHSREPACAPGDPAREAVDRLLLEHAYAKNMPLLAICFGMQMLNVYRGGTLLQDLPPLPVNHAAAAGVIVAHSVRVTPGTLLASLVFPSGDEHSELEKRLPVNSSHHQAVGIAGDGLLVSARCPQDGTAEALEPAPGEQHAFLLGVQWHPERTYASEASRAIFDRLVTQAERHSAEVRW